MTRPRVERIAYSDGWKYRLEQNYDVATGILPPHGTPVQLDYVALTEDGVLRVARGYCWDGATNAPDWECAKRPSLVHDALYQLIGAGLLPTTVRAEADALFGRMCREDGMWGRMASIWHGTVQRFGPRGGSKPKPVRYAPRDDA